MAPTKSLRSKSLRLNKSQKDENISENTGIKCRLTNVTKPLKTKKRSAFSDVTNAVEKSLNILSRKTSLKKGNSIKKPSKHIIEKSVYITPSQSSKLEDISIEEKFYTPSTKAPLPHGVEDFDAQKLDDPADVGEYAFDIFLYYRSRETKFLVTKYLTWQNEISKDMRAVLVDWIVEIQESFGLNHETLYLAIKILDLYLSKVSVSRETLQLVGTTALIIACKFEERLPPCICDFLYLCEDAYTKAEVLATEKNILTKLNFELTIPLSYEFLRRYARSIGLDLETLTLARYILETTLLDYNFIDCSDSMLAAAALLLALKMKQKGTWSQTLEYYSGYDLESIYDLTFRLNDMLQTSPFPSLLVINAKYSHPVFFGVANTPILDDLTLP